MSILTKLKAFFNKPLVTVPEDLASKSQKSFLEHQAKAKGRTTPVTKKEFALAAAVGIPAAALGPTALIRSFIPKTLGGKLFGVVAAPVVYGVVKEKPGEVAKVVTEAPGELSKFGSDIATLATDPSLKNVEKLIEESPVITSLTAAVAALTIAKGLAPVAASAALPEIPKEIKLTLPDNFNFLPPTLPPSTITSPVPVTSQTQVIEAGTGLPSQRRKARRKRKELTPIRISNRNINIIGVRSR